MINLWLIILGLGCDRPVCRAYDDWCDLAQSCDPNYQCYACVDATQQCDNQMGREAILEVQQWDCDDFAASDGTPPDVLVQANATCLDPAVDGGPE